MTMDLELSRLSESAAEQVVVALQRRVSQVYRVEALRINLRVGSGGFAALLSLGFGFGYMIVNIYSRMFMFIL